MCVTLDLNFSNLHSHMCNIMFAVSTDDYSPLPPGTMASFPIRSVIGDPPVCKRIEVVSDGLVEDVDEVFTATLSNPQVELSDIIIPEPTTISITISDCEYN